jgi:hypothetical protein
MQSLLGNASVLSDPFDDLILAHLVQVALNVGWREEHDVIIF